MALTIPNAEFANLAKIAAFDKVFFDSLIKALNETKPSLTRAKYLNDLASRLTGTTKKEISPVLNTLFTLYSVKSQNDFTASDLAKQVREIAVSNKEYGEKFSGENGGILEKRLTALLSYDNSLAVTAKALNVMREHQRVLCHARILTDIRPVFTDKPENPTAAMIVHDLQIGFRNSDGKCHEEFYVSIDDEDLTLLAGVIERAQQKSKVLKVMLKNAQLTCLE